MCSITLTTTLDKTTADRLCGRLRELNERGGERLIVDVTAAIEPDDQAPALLAAVLRTPMSNCEVVVVVPRDSALDRLLPARVAAAWSLTDARRLLAAHPGQRAARERSGPGATISHRDRHILAVRQALRWAEQTAGAGDYDGALRGLATIERVEGVLPRRWHDRRRAWIALSTLPED